MLSDGKRLQFESVSKVVPGDATTPPFLPYDAIIPAPLTGLHEGILADVLRAIAEANHPDAAHAAALAGLIGAKLGDAGLTNTRNGDRFRLVAANGLADDIRVACGNVRITEDEIERLEAGEVIVYEMTPDTPGRAARALLAGGYRWLISVGQRARGKLIGSMTLFYRHAPNLDVVPVLPSLGAALGAQVDLTRGRLDLERRNRLLELLTGIDTLVIEGVSLRNLFGAMATGLREHFAVDYSSIGWAPADDSGLVTWFARASQNGVSDGDTKALERFSRLAVCTAEVQHFDFAEPKQYGLYAPTRLPDGTLILSLVGRHNDFDIADEADARLLSTRFALAYRRTRDLERLERERHGLEALAEANRALRAATEESELAQAAVDQVLRATQACTAIVSFYQPSTDSLKIMAAAGNNAERCKGLELPRGRGLSWHVLEHDRARLETDVNKTPEAMQLRPGVGGAYIGVPIHANHPEEPGGERVIGVLSADTQVPGHHFDDTDLAHLRAVADALSSAHARVRALAEARRRADAFAQLAELSAELETLEDPAQVAQRALQTMLDLTGLEAALHVKLEHDRVWVVGSHGAFPEGLLEAYHGSDPRTRNGAQVVDILEQHGVLEIPDASNCEYEAIITLGVRSLLMAPVRRHGQYIGYVAAVNFNTPAALPPRAAEVARFVGGRLSRALERTEHIREVLATRAATFQALGLALEARDFETKGHTDRVLHLSLELGKALGLDGPQLQALEWGAYLHDIGKIAIPDRILLKPGKLEPDEWAVIRQHPEIGHRLLETLDFLPAETREIVLYHQERSDGSGYPEGRRNHEIPFLARVFAVVDVFDALTSKRPYKRPWTKAEAVEELQKQSGETLDAIVVATFVGLLENGLE